MLKAVYISSPKTKDQSTETPAVPPLALGASLYLLW